MGEGSSLKEDDEQMKTWPVARKIKGIFKMHGSVSLNDVDRYSETR